MFYTETHEKIEDLSNDIFSITISEQQKNELGEILHIETPEVGLYEKDDELGTIEGISETSDFFAPFDLEVIEVNENLIDNPQDLEFESWICKVKIIGKMPDNLLSEIDYENL